MGGVGPAAAAEFDMKCYIYEAGRGGGARGRRVGRAPPLGSYNRRPWQVAPGAERERGTTTEIRRANFYSP